MRFIDLQKARLLSFAGMNNTQQFMIILIQNQYQNKEQPDKSYGIKQIHLL